MGKRILSSVVCVIAALTLLAGCSGDKETASGDSVKTVSIWTGDSHSKEVMNQLVMGYNNGQGKEDGVKISYSVKEGDYYQVVELALASDQAPDFFTGYAMKNFSEKGHIEALENMPGGPEYLKRYEGVLAEDIHTYKGKTYKVPFSAVTVGLIYNKDLFKKYGIVDEKGEAKPPVTLTEMREYAKRLTHPEKKEYGIAIPMKNSWFVGTDVINFSIPSAGYRELNPVTGKFEFEGLRPVLEFYLGVKEDGSYFPGAEGLEDDPARAQFAEGIIGMKLGTASDVGVLNDQFPAKCDWGAAPLPVADQNNRYKQRMASDGYLMINKKSVDTIGAEKLMAVFQWYHGDEVLKELYRQGKGIPYDNRLTDGIVLEKPKTGWEDFCNIVQTSTVIHREAPVDLGGVKSVSDVFLQDIWTGKQSIDDAVAQLNADYEKAFEKKLSSDPSLKREDYTNPQWDIRVK